MGRARDQAPKLLSAALSSLLLLQDEASKALVPLAVALQG